MGREVKKIRISYRKEIYKEMPLLFIKTNTNNFNNLAPFLVTQQRTSFHIPPINKSCQTINNLSCRKLPHKILINGKNYNGPAGIKK